MPAVVNRLLLRGSDLLSLQGRDGRSSAGAVPTEAIPRFSDNLCLSGYLPLPACHCEGA